MSSAAVADVDSTDPQWELLASQQSTGNDNDSLFTLLKAGNFHSVLVSAAARTILLPFAHVVGGASECTAGTLDLEQAIVTIRGGKKDAQEALAIAIAALHAFVQANWTGPTLDEDLAHPMSLLRRVCPDAFPARSVSTAEAGPSTNTANEASSDDVMDRRIHEASLNALTEAGEPAYHLCETPFLLFVSLRIFHALDNGATGPHLASLPWWRLRAASIHTRILDSPVPLGQKIMKDASTLAQQLQKEVTAATANGDKPKERLFRQLRARLLIDQALSLQRMSREKEASELLIKAASSSGLQYEITGALGKRTKFQKEEKTILVLKAASAQQTDEQGASEEDSEAESKIEYRAGEDGVNGWRAAAAPNGQSDMPSEYLHNDDTLLEKTRFSSTAVAETADASASGSLAQIDINKPSPLDPLDSSILLGLCLNISNTAPENGLTSSEMSAFVSRVLAHARNWSVHTMALLLRSRLEANRTRTAQRAALQLQALIDQMPTDDSSVDERLRFFHELELPSKWDMQAELAKRFAGLGVVRSALEIFERIEMWQEAVQCWGALGQQDKAIELLHDLLQGQKTETDQAISAKKSNQRGELQQQRLNTAREAKLWCLLGDLDLEKAEAHYIKAWDVSSHSSARAARSIGGAAFATGDMDKAILWLRRGLRIQPLLSRSWFMLGCAYMRKDSGRGWLEAARCFRRCTALDDDDGESWNNLASCYLRLGQQSQSVISEAARAEHTNAEADQHAVLADLEGEDPQDDVASHYSSDSGIGMASSGDETETEEDREDAAHTLRQVDAAVAATAAVSGGAVGSTSAFDVKLLAHKALLKSLRFSRDDWRVWNNFMIVSVDCGLLNDAVRAMARVLEIRQSPRAIGVGEQGLEAANGAVDVSVLNRIVDAVTRAPSRESDAIAGAEEEVKAGRSAATASITNTVTDESGTSKQVQHNPNEGHGLWPVVSSLLEDVILPRISSSAAIWRAYARLMLWRGRYRTALEAHLSAWRVSHGAEANEASLNTDRDEWLQAIDALQELCELLENFGGRDVVVDEEMNECDGYDSSSDFKREPAMSNWRFRARSLVRTFMGRTRDAWESDQEWSRLEELRSSLAPSAA